MSSLKTNKETNKGKRSTLNTTIDDEVLDAFKVYCKELGFPMNMILESFMSQFVNGEFSLKIVKGNKISVDIEE